MLNVISGRCLKETFILYALIGAFWDVPSAFADSTWEPAKTRVFIVSLTRFENDRLPSFSSDERLDDAMADLFVSRGVPKDQVLLLKDDKASTQAIKSRFSSFLRKSGSAETLIFYFGSHGSRDVKTNDYAFCSYNASLSYRWMFDAIESDFRGNKAILITDCCYSGGASVMAENRKTGIQYACLSSTFANQTARSGWRFAQCLIRGFEGSPVVDENKDGVVDLTELAEYSAKYMAFAAEGKPIFTTKGNFPSKLILSKTKREPTVRQGELIEVQSRYHWEKAEILDSRHDQFQVHFTKDSLATRDTWVTSKQIRPHKFSIYPINAQVEAQNSRDDEWQAARVVATWQSLHLCRYQSSSSKFDEWVGPERIRPSMMGKWAGKWQNLTESGADTLSLEQSKGDFVSGIWSGNIQIKGERLGDNVIYFEATNAGHDYQCVARLENDRLKMEYRVQRPKPGRHYYGWEILRRGELSRFDKSVDVPREQKTTLSGAWVGSYENSFANSGEDTLDLREIDEQFEGEWSGIKVSGRRLGNNAMCLSGKDGKRSYKIVGYINDHSLILNYSATSNENRYFGTTILHAK